MFTQLKNKIAGPGVTAEFLRHPLAYGLMAGVGKRVYTRRGKRAQGMWLDFTARQIKAALKRKGLVVWANAFFPFELLYGLGVVPYRPETVAACAAVLGLSREAISCAECNGYSPDICSFYRGAAGLDIQGLMPPPDIVVSASHLCDGAVKAFNSASTRYGCPHFLLDVPYHDTPDARRYLAGQLRELARIIAEKQGEPFNEVGLARALRLSNESREYLLGINELRHALPCPLPGEDATSYMMDMQFFGAGSRAGVDFFKTIYGDVASNVRNKRGAAAEERFRLLWLHYVRPYYPNDLVPYLESMGASICCNESSYVYWGPLDPASPFESLAAKVLAHPSGGPLERRAGLALKLAEEYQVDGVIHFSHWGCRQSSGGEYVIRDLMRKKDIPMLILDGDGTDSRNYSKEQTRLRLEAFLEMLDARKRR
jgi:benzoyl-CoA reductase/2-hydroxyglutaryl-CoA dehydratase subunit BcrC/BadD/HgdB